VPEAPTRDPLHEFMYSCLRYDSVERNADLSLQRWLDMALDENENRTFQEEHSAATIGKTYPGVEERALRIKRSLQEVFMREPKLSLESAMGLPKREGRKYLETLEGMHPFVSARVTLLVLGGHSFPVDQRMLDLLIEEGVFEEDTALAEAIASMERMIRASDAVSAYLLLQAWAESGGSKRKRSAAKVGAKR